VTVTSQHAKNPAEGWDISATAKADAGEKILRVQVTVNGFGAYDKIFAPPISNWQEQLEQQGQFPGENTVQVIVTSDKGDDTISDDSWT
jgi:hypothetical protein